MRLIIISDVHAHSEKFSALSNIAKNSRPDALVICGDITHFGDLTDASSILKKLASLSVNVTFVPGNCDPPQLADTSEVEGAANLHGKCYPFQGIGFIGAGGSMPTPFRTPFELKEEEMSKVLDSAMRQCREHKQLILVSHNPPFGTSADRVLLGHHVGSKTIRGFIERNSPIVAACGHIHEARSVGYIGATTLVNPGPFHKGYYAEAEVGEKAVALLKRI